MHVQSTAEVADALDRYMQRHGELDTALARVRGEIAEIEERREHDKELILEQLEKLGQGSQVRCVTEAVIRLVVLIAASRCGAVIPTACLRESLLSSALQARVLAAVPHLPLPAHGQSGQRAIGGQTRFRRAVCDH